MPKKYLYGANIVRIQDFIFETGKLKEIAGASEFVEHFCNAGFRDAIGDFKEANLIQGAAGRIKYIFDDRPSFEQFAYRFEQKIKMQIPELAFYQAAVELEGELAPEDLDRLEDRLEAQRQRMAAPHGLGLMISKRSSRTGRPGVEKDYQSEAGDAVVDRSQQVKRIFQDPKKSSLTDKILPGSKQDMFPVEMKKLVNDQENAWIAIVHADGNHIGHVIYQMFTTLDASHANKMQEILKEFSVQLDQSTRSAAQEALQQVVFSTGEGKKLSNLPMRPIILGGDDITVIIRGDLAVDFTAEYLKRFERHTAVNLQNLANTYGLPFLANGLTAGAGIAYIKPNYPFHYGVRLAEELTRHSKDIAKAIDKDRAPSSLAFHKVQSSFVEKYETMVRRELTANDGTQVVRFDYGPYFLTPQPPYQSIGQLKYWSKAIQRDDAPGAVIRQWLSELHKDQAGAAQMMNRIKTLNRRFVHKLDLEAPIKIRKMGEEPQRFTHLFDALTLASIENRAYEHTNV